MIEKCSEKPRTARSTLELCDTSESETGNETELRVDSRNARRLPSKGRHPFRRVSGRFLCFPACPQDVCESSGRRALFSSTRERAPGSKTNERHLAALHPRDSVSDHAERASDATVHADRTLREQEHRSRQHATRKCRVPKAWRAANATLATRSASVCPSRRGAHTTATPATQRSALLARTTERANRKRSLSIARRRRRTRAHARHLSRDERRREVMETAGRDFRVFFKYAAPRSTRGRPRACDDVKYPPSHTLKGGARSSALLGERAEREKQHTL